MTDPKGVPAVSTTPARSQGMAMIVLTAALVGGVAGGVLLDRYVLLDQRPVAAAARPDSVANRYGRGSRNGPSRNPGEMRRRFSERMAKDLGLSPEQHEQMDSIYARQFTAMDALSRSMRPRFDSIAKAAQSQVDSLLTSEQKTKLAELRARWRRNRGPDGPGGGRRPGPGADSAPRTVVGDSLRR